MEKTLILLSDVLNVIGAFLALIFGIKLYLNIRENPVAAMASIFNRGRVAFKLFAIAGLTLVFGTFLMISLLAIYKQSTPLIEFIDSFITVPVIFLFAISFFVFCRITNKLQ
jgi:hypothetical protein